MSAQPLDLNRWLQILFRGFTRKPPSVDDVAFYKIGLDDLPADKLQLAFTETIRRHPTDFLPMPGQIRAYMEAAIEKLPARGTDADETCPDCRGTGFRMIERDGGQVATPCECVKRARVARSQTTP